MRPGMQPGRPCFRPHGDRRCGFRAFAEGNSGGFARGEADSFCEANFPGDEASLVRQEAKIDAFRVWWTDSEG